MRKIVEFNKIVESLNAKGMQTEYNFKEHRTDIYIPGGVMNFPKTVGYITKKNEVVFF